MTADLNFMRRALALAERAGLAGEVPVGAVLVRDDQIVGEGWNRPIATHDPSAHAEILALRDAASRCQNYRLPGSTLYVTIEPCTMCVGALIHARVSRLVFGAREPKAGAVYSNIGIIDATFFNHTLQVEEGVGADEARRLIQEFFQRRREQRKSLRSL